MAVLFERGARDGMGTAALPAEHAAALAAAMEAMAQDYAPMTDMRATSAYRMKAAQNMLWLWKPQSALMAPTGSVVVCSRNLPRSSLALSMY